MALGLNIIVGTRGCSTSVTWPSSRSARSPPVGSCPASTPRPARAARGSRPGLRSRGQPAGHPPELRDRLHPGDHHLRDRRHADRPADTATAGRLHRHRHAGVRRDHRPHRHQRRRAPLQGRSAARRPARGRVRQGGLLQGRQGITPIDKIDFPGIEPFKSLDLRPWFWTALVLVLIVLFVNYRLRDSRLGPGLDRAARGRGGRRLHGRAAREDEAARLRHRRGLRRDGGRLPGVAA